MNARAPILFAILTVLIDAMGIGLILPVMPALIAEVTVDPSLSHAAIWGGILASVFALMQFLFSPVLGRLSDFYGRRPIMLLALAVMAVDYVIMALAGSLVWLLLGRILGGITAATHATANALVADYSPPEKRARRFGLVGMGFGLGFIIGPLIGGILAEWGPRAPFWAAAGLAALNTIFGFFALPRRAAKEKSTPKMAALAQALPHRVFALIWRIRSIRGYFTTYFVMTLSMAVYPAVWTYFAAERFDWPPAMVGISLTVYGLCYAITQGAFVKPFINRFGPHLTAQIGLGLSTIALIATALTTRGDVILALIPISALGSVATPALHGLMSSATPQNSQGALQGAIASQTAVAMILAPIAMNPIFAYFSGDTAPFYLPGAPFILSAALCAVAFMLLLRIGAIAPEHEGRQDQ